MEGNHPEGIELLKVASYIHGVNLISDKSKRTMVYGIIIVAAGISAAGGR